IDNWEGNVVFDKKSCFTPENTILFNDVIRAPVQLLWESFDLCKELRNELPQTQSFKIDDCVKTMDSELRTKQLGINVVGLKFVAVHNSLTFNIGFDIGSERVRLKTITVTFDVVGETTASAQPSIDGGVSAQDPAYSTTPLNLSEITGRIQNVSFGND